MTDIDRRAFLGWLAASPVLAAAASCRAPDSAGGAETGLAAGLAASAADALDIFDLERVAEHHIPVAHWAYLQTGVDHDDTLRRNRDGFDRLHVRPRRLVNIEDRDMRVTLFSREWPTPIVLAPAGSQRAFHTDGELATARAAAARHHLQVLSSVSSTAVEEVNAARAEPVWYQLYPTSDWNITQAVVRRADAAGCPVLVLTVDLPWDSNRLTAVRGERADTRACEACHAPGGEAPPVKPMYEGTAFAPELFRTPALTWEIIARLRDLTGMRIVVKGIVTAEDAGLCVRHGVDAVWVSNHGGRAEGSGRAAIDSLPEVATAVAGRVPVIFDSGIRRGTDIFKALARGADAVAIGRPYLWGLGAFGQEGVERALEILTAELDIAMALGGTRTLSDIGPASISGPA
ncbi:MAG TPA: alpha-hydroxy acid oxidase [Vicinamibacterales bacterium]|nr:alpha-hydroxy acid oxidase [Vicinamibacterales bacterium]